MLVFIIVSLFGHIIMVRSVQNENKGSSHDIFLCLFLQSAISSSFAIAVALSVTLIHVIQLKKDVSKFIKHSISL